VGEQVTEHPDFSDYSLISPMSGGSKCQTHLGSYRERKVIPKEEPCLAAIKHATQPNPEPPF
jgi:hypothetical protein